MMVVYIKDNSRKGSNMEKESIHLVMERFTKESFIWANSLKVD
jgi:hypothetical protein